MDLISSKLHKDYATVSRIPKFAFGEMYKMHKYWGKKSPDVIARYISRFTRPDEIILDPFCGSGITLSEALRLGRKAIGIDINPVATFIARQTITPINLSQFRWAFDDIKKLCEDDIFSTYVTRCKYCKKEAIVEFYARFGDSIEQIAYKCICSDKRIFKDPDSYDIQLKNSFKNIKIPYWYPKNTILPQIQKEKYRYVHELFSRRNLIALSRLLNAIEKLDNPKIIDIMKFAFM